MGNGANEKEGPGRREFLKSIGLASAMGTSAQPDALQQSRAGTIPPAASHEIEYPRTFTGPALKMISFPLGGIGSGSIGLGGRGQLRDWEIFNRPDKGNAPQYAFASIWVRPEVGEPMTHVLESRIEAPYEGQDGLGSRNAPGLSRLQGATFTGEFPRAHIQFHDDRLPVHVSLEAGTPFIPLDADESGLPIAALHYRVSNSARKRVSVSIAFSIENPVKSLDQETAEAANKARVNQIRASDGLHGLFMHNPELPKDDVAFGSFALALRATGGRISALRGWPAGRWWNSPLLFWDDFSSDGELGPEAEQISPVGSICLQRDLEPGESGDYTFLLAWHFPNRTPKRCGWQAPKGHENAKIGNWYATRFADAWSAAEYAATNLGRLEDRTSQFVRALRETTLPGPVKEAASANLSTLVSTTCFRTADGEFHAFEGSDDQLGCCFGNCTHVWNYETATPHLFPSLSRSLRRSAFGFSMDERGAMYFRQLLPDGIERFGYAAADGQMGQIMKVFLDWQLTGDRQFLAEFWPKAKRALSFAWIPGGWDANRDGVLEGVQHNTYDVEFYGPNPLCGIYYLGALRASEEMARAAGDSDAAEYHRLFESGKQWFDSNLFNGSYYVQQIKGRSPDEIAPGLRSGMGADDPEHPQYQLGDGCLVDQLLGQYLADVAGLGPLLTPAHIHSTLDAIYKYNHKPTLVEHDCVERTFALNDEAALVICDYGHGQRPKIPFPYYAEVMTGFEHSTAALMLYSGMVAQGIECIRNIRARYDGVRRNPWDEAECGHHYARAMASWSGILAVSGFLYRGQEQWLTIAPRIEHPQFKSFWSSGTGWGTFRLERTQGAAALAFETAEGYLRLRRLDLAGQIAHDQNLKLGEKMIGHTRTVSDGGSSFTLKEPIRVEPGQPLTIGIVNFR